MEGTFNSQLHRYACPDEPVGRSGLDIIVARKVHNATRLLATTPAPITQKLGLIDPEANTIGADEQSRLLISQHELDALRGIALLRLQRFLLEIAPILRRSEQVAHHSEYWDETAVQAWANGIVAVGEKQITASREIIKDAIWAANCVWEEMKGDVADFIHPRVNELKVRMGKVEVGGKSLRPVAVASSHMVVRIEHLEPERLIAQYPQLEGIPDIDNVFKVVPANFDKELVTAVHEMVIEAIDFAQLRRVVLGIMVGNDIPIEVGDEEVYQRLLILGFDLSAETLQTVLSEIDNVDLIQSPEVLFMDRVTLMKGWAERKHAITQDPLLSTQYRIWGYLLKALYTDLRAEGHFILEGIDPVALGFPEDGVPVQSDVNDFILNILERLARRAGEGGIFDIEKTRQAMLALHADEDEFVSWNQRTSVEDKGQKILSMIKGQNWKNLRGGGTTDAT